MGVGRASTESCSLEVSDEETSFGSDSGLHTRFRFLELVNLDSYVSGGAGSRGQGRMLNVLLGNAKFNLTYLCIGSNGDLVHRITAASCFDKIDAFPIPKQLTA